MESVACAHDSDAELVARTLRGELEAFEPLVERHREAVRRAAARIVGEHEAEDVAQDTFLRAFHRLASYRGDSPFRAWLLRVGHNTALNALAKRRPVPVPGAPDHSEAPDGRPAPAAPADELEMTERRERLRDKLRTLQPHYRSVIVLRDIEGLSYEEIATITGAPLGSVKTRIHRARRELIDMLRRNTYDWQLPE